MIRKLWYIDTMEYYSVMKKNTFESVPMRYYLMLVRMADIKKSTNNKC